MLPLVVLVPQAVECLDASAPPSSHPCHPGIPQVPPPNQQHSPTPVETAALPLPPTPLLKAESDQHPHLPFYQMPAALTHASGDGDDEEPGVGRLALVVRLRDKDHGRDLNSTRARKRVVNKQTPRIKATRLPMAAWQHTTRSKDEIHTSSLQKDPHTTRVQHGHAQFACCTTNTTRLLHPTGTPQQLACSMTFMAKRPVMAVTRATEALKEVSTRSSCKTFSKIIRHVKRLAATRASKALKQVSTRHQAQLQINRQCGRKASQLLGQGRAGMTVARPAPLLPLHFHLLPAQLRLDWHPPE